MAIANRVKESTTSTSTATITLGGASTGFRTFAAGFAVGAAAEVMVGPDSAGAWLIGLYTLTNGTTLTRTAIVDSSAAGADVTLATGTKDVYNTISGATLSSFTLQAATASKLGGIKAGSGVSIATDGTLTVTASSSTGASVFDISFAQAVPLNVVGTSYMPPTTVSAPLAFTPAASAVRGAMVYLRLTADGTNAPTFTGFKEWGGSIGYDNRNGVVNQIQFFYDGVDPWFTVSQAVNSAATSTPAASTGSGTGASTSTVYPLTMTSPTYNTSGKFGSSLNGGYGMATNILPNSSPVTVELWAKNTASAVQPAIGCSYGMWIGMDSNGKATLHWGGDANGATENVITTTVTVNDGGWHHYSANIDPQGTGATFYVDGVLAGSNSGTGKISTAASFGVRAFGGNTGFAWTGEVDEVAIYAGIKRNANFTPQTASTSNTEGGLLALWHLDGNGTDSNAISSSTYTRLATLDKSTEMGVGPYSYQGRSGNWLNGAGGVSKMLASGTDGSIAFGINALNSNVGLLIAISNGSTKVPYSGTLVAVYPDTQGNNHYNTITNGDAGGRQDSGVTAQVGDILRLRRSGSTVVAEYARSSTPTTFSTLRTWAGQTTGAVYFQVDVSGAGTVAQNLTGAGIA